MVRVLKSVRIVNSAGLHARPCHQLAAAALASQSRVTVRCDDREADGKSILELMTLAAPLGSVLEFEAEGADAEAVVERLSQVVASGFGESA
ncbi:MAG: HPr family phosphocarrier protein [Planctomycetes bacterium]|nr:HPr family phosphocarrier protein [Planctomycetota bacterium]